MKRIIKKKYSLYYIIIISFLNGETFANSLSDNQIKRSQFTANGKYVTLEVLSDDIIHIETGKSLPPSLDNEIYKTPMISPNSNFNGPTFYQLTGNQIVTANLTINIENTSMCIAFFNKKLNYSLANICPENLENDVKTLNIKSTQNKNAYGLGQYFYDPNTANGDWIGRKWIPGEFGNAFVGFSGGANSKIQFPILYALGEGTKNYAIFIDNQYKMSWDFTNPKAWLATMWGDKLRYYIIAGDNLEQLRSKYLKLTGMPTIPPKKTLGLWISQYGYKNWNEINTKLNSIRQNKFPIDGFALDLYWFGGSHQMGAKSFDLNNFPNPEQQIKEYKEQGIGLMPIQEPYISDIAKPQGASITEYQDLVSRCYLVKKNATGCNPSYFKDTWWGSGGMIDWSNDKAADYWFDKKEVPLINMGISNFWLDLNEPEMYDPNSYYSGYTVNGVLKNRHADIANLYALKWIESFDRGYVKNKNKPRFNERPLFMSRAGAPGMQRYGAGMWSGDIGANLGALKAHINNATNVSLSGVDIYSADTGGFHRNTFDGHDIHKLYTQWIANAAVFDFPIRPHTWVGETANSETTPSLIGDINSNKENIRQRYKLAPYYYSLFYRAHLYGEAVTPSIVSLFQEDKVARTISSEKMIGKFLLGSTVTQYQDPIRYNIYLPEGRWLNYHTLDEVTISGKTHINFPIYLNGIYKIPLFVRTGAIIPQAYVDDKTMDMQGLRSDGSKNNELIVKIIPSEIKTNFTLYEDDGYTQDYKLGKYSQTSISQIRKNNIVTIKVSASQGQYNGMPLARKHLLQIAVPNETVTFASVNGESFAKCDSFKKINCWDKEGRNSYTIKTDNINKNKETIYIFSLQPAQTKIAQYNFTCKNAYTNLGESIYVIGNTTELGNWDTNKSIKLSPVEYPIWSGYIENVSINGNKIEWKCIKKNDATNAVLQWQNGVNNSFHPIQQGYGGNVEGSF